MNDQELVHNVVVELKVHFPDLDIMKIRIEEHLRNLTSRVKPPQEEFAQPENDLMTTIHMTHCLHMLHRVGCRVPSITPGWSEDFVSYDSEKNKTIELLRGRMATHLMPEDTEAADIESWLRHYVKGLILQLCMISSIPGSSLRWLRDPIGALGYGVVHHHAISEFGLSLTDDTKTIPSKIVDACRLYMTRSFSSITKIWRGTPDLEHIDLDDYLHVKASFPRGKNSGMPLVVSGRNRMVNDVVMALNAGLASALVRGYDPAAMFDGLCTDYIVFSRYQRSGKPIPMTIKGKRFTSSGVEPRRRIINSTPKPIAMAVKPAVKALTALTLAMPEFTQDRHLLTARLKAAATVVAIDASRFDLRNGGQKLVTACDVMFDCLEATFTKMPNTIRGLAQLELSLPTLVDYDLGSDRVIGESSLPALRSGASTTSRVGCTLNLMYDMYVTASAENLESAEDIVDYYMKHHPSAILGDDLLKFFPSVEASQRYLASVSELANVGMDYGIEDPTKFLGYLVHDPRDIRFDTWEAPDALGSVTDEPRDFFHSSNPLGNMFFPERFNADALASVLNRYLILTRVRAADVLTEVQRMCTDDVHLGRLWNDAFDHIYPILAAHYNDHPRGLARVWFQSLPTSRVELSDAATLRKLHKNLVAGIDAILYTIGRGSEFDMNFNLIGVDLGTVTKEYDDEHEVTIALADHNTSFLDNVRAFMTSEVKGGSKLIKSVNQRNKLLSLMSPLTATTDDEFVSRWRSVLPIVARRLSLNGKDVYVANI